MIVRSINANKCRAEMQEYIDAIDIPMDNWTAVTGYSKLFLNEILNAIGGRIDPNGVNIDLDKVHSHVYLCEVMSVIAEHHGACEAMTFATNMLKIVSDNVE